MREARRAHLDARNEQIVHMYITDGLSLGEVGAKFGLTRERVRQILVEAGITRRHGGQGRDLSYEVALRTADARIAAGVSDVPTEAELLGIQPDSLRAAFKRIDLAKLSSARPRRVGRRRSPGTVKYSDEEVLSCLREANRILGGILSAAAYTAFARQRRFDDGRPWPSNQTGYLRFGSWRSALEAAGLAANASSPVAGHLLFTDGHCIDAILEVERAVGGPPTVAEYERYAADMAGVLPSSATVRNRFGSWHRALEAAADFAA